MLSGWRPRTFHHHDETGRLAWSETESPWEDPYEMASLDAMLDWEANLHSCGRPMTESLEGAQDGITEDSYVVGTQRCLACMHLEKWRAQRAKGEQKQREQSGVNPDAWRLDRVNTLAEAKAIYASQHPTPHLPSST